MNSMAGSIPVDRSSSCRCGYPSSVAPVQLVLGIEASDAGVDVGSLILIDPPWWYPFGEPIGIDAAAPNTALNVPIRLTLSERLSRPTLSGPVGRCELRNGPSTGWSPALSTSSPRRTLVEGPISQSDRILVELVAPQGQPQMIMIRWPDHPTIVQPRRFAEVASEAMRILGRANVTLTQLRSARRL
jgi:hypothetical protein